MLSARPVVVRLGRTRNIPFFFRRNKLQRQAVAESSGEGCQAGGIRQAVAGAAVLCVFDSIDPARCRQGGGLQPHSGPTLGTVGTVWTKVQGLRARGDRDQKVGQSGLPWKWFVGTCRSPHFTIPCLGGESDQVPRPGLPWQFPPGPVSHPQLGDWGCVMEGRMPNTPSLHYVPGCSVSLVCSPMRLVLMSPGSSRAGRKRGETLLPG